MRSRLIGHPLTAFVVVGALLVAASLGLLLAGRAGAAPTSVTGHTTIEPVSGPSCTSPVGICTRGSISGGVKGTYAFTAADVLQTVDTPSTGVVVLLGDMEIQVKGGTLLCDEVNALSTVGNGPFASQCTIIGGTGSMAGASGQLLTTGRFTLEGGGEGDYRGEVIIP